MSATDSGYGTTEPALDVPADDAHTGAGRTMARGLAWVVGSLLATIFGVAIFGVALYAYSVHAGLLGNATDRQAQIIVGVYFWVVTLKGLLPQQLLVLALWPAWRRLAPGFTEARGGAVGALILSALVGYGVVVTAVLTRQTGGLPGLQIQTWVQHAGSIVLMTFVVVLSTWAFGRLSGFLPPTPPAES